MTNHETRAWVRIARLAASAVPMTHRNFARWVVTCWSLSALPLFADSELEGLWQFSLEETLKLATRDGQEFFSGTTVELRNGVFTTSYPAEQETVSWAYSINHLYFSDPQRVSWARPD